MSRPSERATWSMRRSSSSAGICASTRTRDSGSSVTVALTTAAGIARTIASADRPSSASHPPAAHRPGSSPGRSGTSPAGWRIGRSWSCGSRVARLRGRDPWGVMPIRTRLRRVLSCQGAVPGGEPVGLADRLPHQLLEGALHRRARAREPSTDAPPDDHQRRHADQDTANVSPPPASEDSVGHTPEREIVDAWGGGWTGASTRVRPRSDAAPQAPRDPRPSQPRASSRRGAGSATSRAHP